MTFGRKGIATAAVLCGSLALSGCNSTRMARDEQVAVAGIATGLVGGVACAALGGRPETCMAIGVAAAAAGALIMNAIAEEDRPAFKRSAARVMTNGANWQSARLAAPPQRKAVAWRNPDTKNGGDIIPLRAYKSETGQDCREAAVTYKGTEPGNVVWCKGANGAYGPT